MPSARDFKRMLAPLLQAYPELALCGRVLVVKPVRHILRGIFLDATSSRHIFRPTSFANALCEPMGSPGIGCPKRIRRASPGPWENTVPDIGVELLARVRLTALPQLQPLTSVEAYYDWAMNPELHDGYTLAHSANPHLCATLALGRLADARAICERFLNPEETRGRGYSEDWYALVRQLYPLIVEEDRKALATLLHGWEAEAAKAWKLEAIWEPSPFPLEHAR